MTAATAPDAPRPLVALALVSLGHGLNHLLVMAVPPLVVVWTATFAVDYAAIGLVMAAVAVASAAAVLPVGFLVDRVPARLVLIAGLTVISLATIGFGLAQSYWHLLACGVLAGLGNTVFHPCGYTILSAAVPRAWLGRAFSIHTFAGYAGFAATPAILGLALLYGDWRAALIAMGCAGLTVAALMALARRQLHDGRERRGDAAQGAQGAQGGRAGFGRKNAATGIGLLLSLPVAMCFLFFLLTTIAYWGFDGFLPAALFEHHGVPEATGTFALSVFFGFTALGILAGGVLADRTHRHGLTAALGFSVAAAAIFLIGEIEGSIAAIHILIAIAGLGSGVVTPSRDLIVRKVTPTGETGKVFAFMTFGMDAGSALAPPAFGLLMDGGQALWLFRATALMLLLSILTVAATRRVHTRMEPHPHGT